MIKIICKRTIEAVYFEEIFELYRKKWLLVPDRSRVISVMSFIRILMIHTP